MIIKLTILQQTNKTAIKSDEKLKCSNFENCYILAPSSQVKLINGWSWIKPVNILPGLKIN